MTDQAKYEVAINPKTKEPLSVNLNFTNLKDNSNKFFILQILKHKEKQTYEFFNRYGRLGAKGTIYQHNIMSLDQGISQFAQKKKEKMRKGYQEVEAKKFDLNDDKAAKMLEKAAKAAEESSVKSALHPDVFKIVKDFNQNVSEVDKIAIDLGYDSKQVPISSISVE